MSIDDPKGFAADWVSPGFAPPDFLVRGFREIVRFDKTDLCFQFIIRSPIMTRSLCVALFLAMSYSSLSQ
jgi:hypothetical protein